jgi:superfamily II DNA or RNA helicase
MRKDSLAPDLAKCQDCTQLGPACKTFKARKTPQQEQKERDENGGQDPVVDVPSNLVNNAQNVLFRCTHCWRAYHYHHLPPLSQYSMVMDRDEEETADDRFQEYSKKWLCKDCHDTEKLKVSGLIAWRPSDLENFQPGTLCNMLSEDDKQYLIKWADQSYFQASWHSGAWTWGVTAAGMRKAFYKREDGPKMRTEDAIPEEFLRIDIVLEVKYTSYVEIGSEEIDKARIKEVDKALIKYKGLGYEDAVWEKVPTPEDGDRWLDFVTAYNDWVAGRYIKYPKLGPLKSRLEKVRGAPFSKLEKTKQPENLVGGELMKYQIEGLNWLYYQWHNQTNGILADEMGLGKTIQVIGFMATLIQEHNCFPFLVVVPNSTCANWRREIKHWAPSLRVVTYFGSAAARDMAYKYEMFPQGQKDLRCHIVVTSYEAATDDSSRFKLRRITWAGLIVDEGQRLKNDKSQLYSALTAVKAPFRLLLTGTPLQNNARELFNLLQFLDDTINAAELEEKYTDMTTAENIRELHDQIRPFILRRTKAQVLTFLPPLGQIIVPLSMSVLQKTLYKSILAKNPQLLKALFVTQKQLRQQERANLSNILMQLRKCLCHPFVYSREIEERTDLASVSHRNLVEASAKLQFLELMLPKLQERGHRVLIFSQFLDMLSIIEDFLDGLQMTYQRLDGTMGSLEKQKRIDQFNEPDSPLFAFLLSTRAGGVGINLATADTVIILDPDFNPHQDLQAISRAHRIGQKKKVLCFQLTTRASAEEKITQMGRKKMALDHVVVEQLDAEDLEDEDVESILKYGAAELFKDDAIDHDIRYDEASIEKLLDRTQMENTKTAGDDSAESQFSFARVWANDEGALQDNLDTTEDAPPDPGVWDKILKERQEAAAVEAMARANALGRGKRTRMVRSSPLNLYFYLTDHRQSIIPLS